MKNKILTGVVWVTALFWLTSSSFADFSLMSERINGNEVKVNVVSDSSDVVTSAGFSIWFDPSIEIKDAMNWNLLANWTPVTWEGSISYFWDSSVEWISSGFGTVASFTMVKPEGSSIESSIVELVSWTTNWVDQATGSQATISFDWQGAVVESVESNVVIDSSDTETKTWSAWYLFLALLSLVWAIVFRKSVSKA